MPKGIEVHSSAWLDAELVSKVSLTDQDSPAFVGRRQTSFNCLAATMVDFTPLQENEEADFMIFSSTFFLLFIFPLGVWLIQPSVNELYQKLEKPVPADEA